MRSVFGKKAQKPTIYFMLSLNCVAAILLILIWNIKVEISNHSRSLPLIILFFLGGLVDCTTSVVFIPYMANFPSMFITSYLIGEGLSELFPSMLALLQGVKEDTEEYIFENRTITEIETITTGETFTPEIYFTLTSIFTILGLLAFFVLNNITPPKTQNAVDTKDTKEDADQSVSYKFYVYLLFLTGVVNLVDIFLMSVHTYSALAYGNKAYHLSVVLSMIANPVICCISFIITRVRGSVLTLLTSVLILIGSYLLVAALQSPFPVLKGTQAGVILIVSIYIRLRKLD